MRKWTAVAAGAALSFALVLPGAASAQTSPPLAWTRPVLIEHAPFARGNLMTAASCPGTRLCVVADDVGDVFTSTDPASTKASAWPNAGVFANAVSCPSPSLCVAGNLSGQVRIGSPRPRLSHRTASRTLTRKQLKVLTVHGGAR